jgi:dTDP-4-dehydrorhamnose 3,5-epimerase
MADLQIRDQPLPGVYVLDCPRYPDHRGDFTKLFHAVALQAHGISFTPAESFLTRSKAGVLRGMHFQVGDAAHLKLVACPKGRVLDVVVDVRPESPYFNKPFTMELAENNNTALLIAKGYAHGFLALDDDSWMLYYTSTIHSPAMDWGVLWSSIALDWPIRDPIISDRDAQHPPIEAF